MKYTTKAHNHSVKKFRIDNMCRQCLITYITVCLISIFFNGCGYYSFSGASLPGIEKVYVPVFGNSTTEFGIEQDLTDAIVDAVNKNNQLSYSESNSADAILDGRITAFSDGLMTFTGDEQVTEYSVRITVQVKFVDIKNQKTILEDVFTATYSYDSSDFTKRQGAIDQALKKIAEDIINSAFSGW